MSGTWSIASRVATLLLSISLAILLAVTAIGASSEAASAQGTVKLEWLGNLFYRLTSPNGVVVLTSPQLINQGDTVLLDEVVRTDIILSPNSHNDDMGNAVEIATISGATVITPGALGRWMIEQGLEPTQFRRAGVGDRFTMRDLSFKIGPSWHDNTLATGADGGPAASYFVTFENGLTVFFNGHSTMIADLAIYAAAYQPEVAILGLNEAIEFAHTARLMATDNPRLRMVIPSHQRPEASIVAEGRAELEKLGLGHLWFMPELRQVYDL
jgi:L-ascorbate metabolism protein UlaG (beta-lactamase superfamily)